ncbi:MAG: hypothetical protein ACO1OD_14125 [Croceibacterium sp.]
MIGAALLLPVIAGLLMEPNECDDIACGFLLFAWLWRSVSLVIGVAVGVFCSMLSPWGTE